MNILLKFENKKYTFNSLALSDPCYCTKGTGRHKGRRRRRRQSSRYENNAHISSHIQPAGISGICIFLKSSTVLKREILDFQACLKVPVMLRPRFPSCLARGPKIMKKTIIIATSGILVTKVMWQLYDAYRRSRRKEVNEVMFFSKDSTLCHSHLGCMEPCARMDCAVGHLRRIIYYLDSATDTLDVCLYLFTCPQLAEAIIKAKKRNVVIRMILDESMSQNSASQIMNFYKEGINLKSKKLDSLMHHKFVVIDNNILINGSLNWTTTAFFGNFENVQVTNVSALVKPFINEFEKMWTMLNTMATQADSIQRNLNVTV